MAYKTRSEFVDAVSQTHVIRLWDPEVSTDPAHDHLVQLELGVHACALCGRTFDQTLKSTDPVAVKEQVAHRLKRHGQRAKAYAKRHGVEMKTS